MPKKLLLADNSVTIQKVVELVLSEEDFEITTADNGSDALKKIEDVKQDIVLVDINLPEINGYDICAKIKENEEWKNTPVILLSGAFEPIDEEKAKSIGASSFIIKPFESQELLSKISDALGKNGGSSDDFLGDESDIDLGMTADISFDEEPVELDTTDMMEEQGEGDSDEETMLDWDAALKEQEDSGGEDGLDELDSTDILELTDDKTILPEDGVSEDTITDDVPSEELSSDDLPSEDDTMLDWEAAFAEQEASEEGIDEGTLEQSDALEEESAAESTDASDASDAGDSPSQLIDQDELDKLMESIKEEDGEPAKRSIDAEDDEEPLELDSLFSEASQAQESEDEDALLKDLEQSALESVEPPIQEDEEVEKEEEPRSVEQPAPRETYTPRELDVPAKSEAFLTKGEILYLLNESIGKKIDDLLSVVDNDKITTLLKDAITELTNESFSKISDDFQRIVNEAIDRKINETLDKINLENILRQVIESTIKGIYDNFSGEAFAVTKDVIEDTLKNILEEKVLSVKSDAEKVMWDTMPDIAERLIKNELEQLKADFM